MTVSKNDSILTHETKIALLEQSIGHVNESLLRIEKRFDLVDKKFELLETKMDKGFSDLRREINDTRLLSWSQFRWLLGTMVICILIPIAKGFLT